VWEIAEQNGPMYLIGCVDESAVNYITDTLVGFFCFITGYLAAGGE